MHEDWPFRVSLIGLYTAYTLIRLVYHREMARDDSRDVVRELADRGEAPLLRDPGHR